MIWSGFGWKFKVVVGLPMEVVVIEGLCLGSLNEKLVIRKFDGKGCNGLQMGIVRFTSLW
jgi:hypothetical protein